MPNCPPNDAADPQFVFIPPLIVTALEGLTINTGGQRSGGFSAWAGVCASPGWTESNRVWNGLDLPPSPELLPFPAHEVNSNNNFSELSGNHGNGGRRCRGIFDSGDGHCSGTAGEPGRAKHAEFSLPGPIKVVQTQQRGGPGAEVIWSGFGSDLWIHFPSSPGPDVDHGHTAAGPTPDQHRWFCNLTVRAKSLEHDLTVQQLLIGWKAEWIVKVFRLHPNLLR